MLDLASPPSRGAPTASRHVENVLKFRTLHLTAPVHKACERSLHIEHI